MLIIVDDNGLLDDCYGELCDCFLLLLFFIKMARSFCTGLYVETLLHDLFGLARPLFVRVPML